MIQKQAIINDNMRQKQTVVQEDNVEQEQYSASVKVEDAEEDRMMDAEQENSLMLVYQDVTMDFSDELKECSRLIYEAEEKMEIMNAALEE